MTTGLPLCGRTNLSQNNITGNHLRPPFQIAIKIHALNGPNRASDPVDEDVLECAYPFIKQAWSGERAESWYLQGLAVHPAFQARGIGRMLVRRGRRPTPRSSPPGGRTSSTGRAGLTSRMGTGGRCWEPAAGGSKGGTCIGEPRMWRSGDDGYCCS